MANTAQNGKKRTAKRTAKPGGAKAAAAKSPRKTQKPSSATPASAKRARPRPKTRAQTRPASPPDDFPYEDDFDGVAQDASEDGYAAAMDQASARAGRAAMRDGETYLDFLARMFDDMNAGGWNADQLDALTQGYTMVLGSGPAFVALESMVANVSSQSAVMMNAAHTQRQLDHVGLCCTSACVKQLLSLNSSGQDE